MMMMMLIFFPRFIKKVSPDNRQDVRCFISFQWMSGATSKALVEHCSAYASLSVAKSYSESILAKVRNYLIK